LLDNPSFDKSYTYIYIINLPPAPSSTKRALQLELQCHQLRKNEAFNCFSLERRSSLERLWNLLWLSCLHLLSCHWLLCNCTWLGWRIQLENERRWGSEMLHFGHPGDEHQGPLRACCGSPAPHRWQQESLWPITSSDIRGRYWARQKETRRRPWVVTKVGHEHDGCGSLGPKCV